MLQPKAKCCDLNSLNVLRFLFCRVIIKDDCCKWTTLKSQATHTCPTNEIA